MFAAVDGIFAWAERNQYVYLIMYTIRVSSSWLRFGGKCWRSASHKELLWSISFMVYLLSVVWRTSKPTTILSTMVRSLQLLLFSVALVASTPALAQLSISPPVLAVPPGVYYPPIARAAHVSGDVTVTFAINPDGTTTSVQLVSGTPMLVGSVFENIKKWRFKTPLPLNAQTYFEAKYAFRIKTDEDDDDNLENPPYTPGGGDVIITKASGTTLIGDVHSLDGSQIIDVTATSAAKAVDRCPKDTQKQPPDKTDFSDYVELFRYNCDEGCTNYRVRVYRSGRVTWRGFDGVVATGDREGLISSSLTETLLNDFQTDSFWSTCSVPYPPDPTPKPKVAAKPAPADDEQSVDQGYTEEEPNTGTFLTASIGGITKTVNVWQFSSTDDDAGNTLAWRIDRAADTHRWRHPDPATEPYNNMYEDIETPKPGVTFLMRATHHFNPYTGQQTFTHLEKLLKNGEPVEDADASGWTALMYAANLDYWEDTAVKLLLNAHADPNRASLHGDTALMFAAYRGTLSKLLLDHGANLNAHNAEGVTPLMLLVQQINPDELKDALALGADANAHDDLGRTALDYLRAASCGKSIIPPPPSYGMVFSVVTNGPPPCPANTPEYKQSEALLRAAMKDSATHP